MRIYLLILLVLFMAVTVSAETSEQCTSEADECVASCNDKCNTDKYDYCRKYEYSGCALDVFCYCNVCGVYDQKWCLNDGWVALSSGPKELYESCIKGCQSKFEAGQDVSTCWADCNEQFNTRMVEVKDGVCDKYCKNDFYQSGKWANFYEGQWDTCMCEGDVVEESITEDLFPDPGYDSDADGVPDQQDWCPEEEGSISAYGCPDKDNDGVPDFADKCNDEYGTWEWAGCKKTDLDNFSEAPYKFWEGVKYMFTPQGEANAGKKQIGLVKNILNKKGVRKFSEKKKKWYPIGIGTPIFEGDLLRTGGESKVKLVMFEDDQSSKIVDLLPQTIFTAPHSSDYYKGERPIIHLIKGAAKVAYNRITGNEKPNFYVKTPQVVLGIRGTEFIVSTNDGVDTIQVLEGEVAVGGTTEAILVPGGKIVATDGVLGSAETIDIEAVAEEYKDDYDMNIPWNWIVLALVITGAGLIIYVKRRK